MSRSGTSRAATACLAVFVVLSTCTAAYAAKPKPKPTKAPGLGTSFTYALGRNVSTHAGVPLVTEAPDGTVYFASAGVIYRVVGQSSTSVARKIDEPVYALTASSDLFVVETRDDVTAYSRSSGKEVATWAVSSYGSLPPVVESVGDLVWSFADLVPVNGGFGSATVSELRIGKLPKTISSNASPIAPVVDSSGDLFFVSFKGKIVRVSPTGSMRRTKDASYGAATLAYADGTLLAEVDETSTVDYELSPVTLGLYSSSKGHQGDYYGLVETSIGDLSLSKDCGTATYCKKTSVQRISLPDSRGATGPVPFGAVVLSPQPIVLELPTTGSPKLVGIA